MSTPIPSLAYLPDAMKLAQLTESEVYRLAVSEFDGISFGMGNEDDGAFTSRVHKWISDNRQALRRAICSDRLSILHSPSESTREKALIIAAIADCLAGVVIGISPLTASAMVTNYGLRRICNPDK